MNKKNVQVNINDHRQQVQVNIEGDGKHVQIDNNHVQIDGNAYYDNSKYFLFTPFDPVPGRVPSFRHPAIIQQMSDGTIDCTVTQRKKCQSILIKKVPHGRISATKDGCIQFTFKMAKMEGLNIADALRAEAISAAEAVE